ncbi:unnamed protein product [Heterobilharzia americana]|nr:unnamed protein product [Heterobilharzia americana]
MEEREDFASEDMNIRHRSSKTNLDEDIRCSQSSVMPSMATSTLTLAKLTPSTIQHQTLLQVNTHSTDNDKQKLIHDVVWCDLAEQFRLNLIAQLDDHLKVSLSDLVTTAISRENNLQSTQTMNDWMTDKPEQVAISVDGRVKNTLRQQILIIHSDKLNWMK